MAMALLKQRRDIKKKNCCLWQWQCHPHLVTFQQVLMEDDNDVNAIFNMLDRQYGFVGAELYVGVEPIRSH